MTATADDLSTAGAPEIPVMAEARLALGGFWLAGQRSKGPIGAGLAHLVELRASQLNGCHFCRELHAREARKAGETEARLGALADWRDSDAFSPAERAALDWAEALTRRDPAAIRAGRATLAAHFDRQQRAALTVAVAAINAWNTVGLAEHGADGEQQHDDGGEPGRNAGG